MTKIEVHINDGFCVQKFDVTGDPEFNAMVNRKYDRFGQLEGGFVISKGRVTGYVDASGEPGMPGWPGDGPKGLKGNI